MWVATVTLLVLGAGHGLAQERYEPKIAAESGEGQLALQGFQIPEGMSGRLLAAEPLLANPVAFHITMDGRLYVCETFRQEAGVEDNRSHMNWLLNDLRLETVEERLAMFRKHMGDEVHRWSREHDRIRLLVDTDGDGRFDRSTVFADGFNDILDGTGAGVLEHQGKVCFTCIPKLWLLEDTTQDGVADRRQILHHGYGVRVAFRGHDLHGLILGPDGRLYFSLGDRGYNVVTTEGTRLKRPDTGAVFRCDPDGSHLEVFAYGLRNPQELAFDDSGNLFTGDNNSDSGDQARWVYVVQDGDSGWRMHFQYLDDRGPWNRERMWYPWQADEQTRAVQPAFMIPPVAHLGDGPSGLTYYPGVGLPDRYRAHFFMADFRGTPGNSGIRSFAVQPQGATFVLTDSHQFIWSILATDVDFAADGSLYVSDWVNGWLGEGRGRIYRFADESVVREVVASGSPELLARGFAEVNEDRLLQLLSHRDRRVRQQAQFELVRRGAGQSLLATAGSAQQPLARLHAYWGIWQLGLKTLADGHQTIRWLAELAERAEGDDAAQLARIIGDVVQRHGMDAISDAELRNQLRIVFSRQALGDDWRLAGFAAAALGTVGRADDSRVLLTVLDRINNQDPVVRHQASMGLTRLAERNPGLLRTLIGHSGAAGRMGIVLAMRRLHDPALGMMLRDADNDVALEAARAIHDEGLEGELLLQLADVPFDSGTSDPLVRRIMNACYRVGTADMAARVAEVCIDDRRPDAVRMQAAEMLQSWNQPRDLDTVTGNWRPIAVRREVEGLEEAIEPYLPAMLAGPERLRATAVRIASTLGITDLIPTLQALLMNTMTQESVRVSSFRALMVLNDRPDGELLLQRTLQDPEEALRLAAVELLVSRQSDESVERLSEFLRTGSIQAQQQAMRLLGQVGDPRAEGVLLSTFEKLNRSTLPDQLILDLLEAATERNTEELRSAVNVFRQQQQEPGTILALWSECLTGGDAVRGQEIFFGRSAASCRRCHKVDGDGGEVGPGLSGIGAEKDRNHLLESIVDPSAKIAKGFETVILVTTEGRIHAGVLRREDRQMVELMTPEGALIRVANEDIEERASGQSGMPADIARNLTRAEIRDLVEYLTTLKRIAPTPQAGVDGADRFREDSGQQR